MLQTFIFLCCDGQASFHLFTVSANVCATGFLLLLPLFLLPARVRWLQIVWMFVIAALMIANIWYLRVFEDFMSPANVMLLTTVDSTVARGTIAVMRWYDFSILFPPAICAFVFARQRGALNSYSLRLRIAGIIVCVMGTACSVFKLHRDYYLYLESTGHVNSLESYISILNENMSRRQQVLAYGFAVSQTIELWKTLLGATHLSETDLENISSLANRPSMPRTTNGKNLIVVVVESLNSTAVQWDNNGIKAMPFLNALLSDSTVLTFTNMVSIVGEARSADGQFMYHTGMFPLRSEPFVVANASGPYPSLQRQLPNDYTSIEIIGEDATQWHHKETSLAYGFDQLYADISTGQDNSETSCQDAMIFEEAQTIIANLKQPFYAMISTLTMHDPYSADESSTNLPFVTAGMDERDANYLQRCNLFDKSLARFMEWLKSSSIWNNTIVAVVSDHEARRSCLSPEINSGNQFFAILNTGSEGKHSNDILSQIDVYPTLLDALGMLESSTWAGLGKSVFNGQATGFALKPDETIAGTALDSTAIARQKMAWPLMEKWIRARNKSAALSTVIQ